LRVSLPIIRRAAAVAVITLLTVHSAFSQSSPLESRVRTRIGLEAGLSLTTQQGLYRAGCGEFDHGTGMGPIFALAYDGPLGTGIRYEGLLGFHGRSSSGSYITNDSTRIATENGVASALVQFERKGTVASSSIFLLPSVRYSITPWLYAGVGASAGLVFSTTTEYSQEILTRTVEYNGVVTEVFFDPSESSDPQVKTDPAEDRDDASTLLLDGVIYLGADFRVADDWTAGPRVMYSLPLTPIFSAPSLSISSLQIMIGVRRAL
jgi:hypothetical protein